MTESEANAILKAEIVHHPECSIFAEALALAIRALEKQIPKKPVNKSFIVPYDGINVCPSCKEPLGGKKHYCCNCGQKLDFGE